jgi:kynurenine formamidase
VSELPGMAPSPPDELAELAGAVTNWGRWGDDDELGTLNTIDDAARGRGAAAVRTGRSFGLSIPFDEHGPQMGHIGRINPVHTMTATGGDNAQKMDLGGGARFNDDFVAMPLQCATHWDSLAHVHYGGQMYNGFASGTVDALGASKLGIEKAADRFVTRGVLLDIARLHAVDRLAPDHAIDADELDRACAAAGVEIQAGDVVVVRTGLMGTWRSSGTWAGFAGMQPGLHYETAAWFRERDVAGVACDNAAVEHLGLSMPGVMLPFHMLALRDMGLHLGEYWMLEDLAAACAAQDVADFLLVAAPLPVTGAVGAPVHPVAVL